VGELTNYVVGNSVSLSTRLVGDPLGKFHPVALIGRLISFLERVFKRGLRRFNLTAPQWDKLAGTFLAVSIPSIVFVLTLGFIKLASLFQPILAVAISIVLISTSLAPRSLVKSAKEVLQTLAQDDLCQARMLTAKIVGRDTNHLDKSELIRAVVETVAENIVDAVVSPLFYAFLGGAPLAMAYRAINTLDSMVGYKNDDYRHFGWASARLDDIANFIPARMTMVFIPLAACLLGKNGKASWRTIWRDRKNHSSPNSGIPEAGVAGALGVRLGGMNYYQGKEDFHPYLGEDGCPLSLSHMNEAVDLCCGVSLLTIVFITLVGLFAAS
jgi:adenosylcobinamide-phosphate synthase